jgi:hypothetical protein
MAQIGLVALLAMSVAVLPCPACYAPQAAARQKVPATGHECCHRHSNPNPAQSSQNKTPHCGWMPADNGQPEAKTDVAKNLDFFAVLSLETDVFSHFLDSLQIVADFSPDGVPASPPALTAPIRC